MKLNRRQVLKAGLAASTVYSPWMLGIAQSKPITFALMRSGPTPTPEQVNQAQAFVDFPAFINDNGGINGRKFEIIQEGVNGDPSKGPDALGRLLTRAPDTLFVWAGDGLMAQAVAPEIKRLMMPWFPNAYLSSFTNRENYPSGFLVSPIFDQCLLALIPEIKRQKSNATVALMISDTPQGKEPLPTFKAQAAKDGIKIVAEVVGPPTLNEAAAAPFVAKLVEANADFVVMQGYFQPSDGTIVKVARAAGLKSVIMGGYITASARTALAAADGFITVNHLIFHTEADTVGKLSGRACGWIIVHEPPT